MMIIFSRVFLSVSPASFSLEISNITLYAAVFYPILIAGDRAVTGQRQNNKAGGDCCHSHPDVQLPHLILNPSYHTTISAAII